MDSWLKTVGIAAVFGGIAAIGWQLSRDDPYANPVVADNPDQVTVLSFSTMGSTSELPEGWTEQVFWSAKPMRLSLVTKNDVPALRCETNGSGSILNRSTDIEVGDYPVLAWSWYIEVPVESPLDEATAEGDDHPARLLLKMEDRSGGEYAFEIIWSNRKYKPGDYKYIGDVAHYVANGLNENTGSWQDQEVNLMQIYRDVTGRDDYPILKSIGIFCDTDNTGVRSVAYFTDVEMRRR